MVSNSVQVQGVHKTGDACTSPPLDTLSLGIMSRSFAAPVSPTVSRKTNNTQNVLSKWDMRVETIKLDVINST